MQEAPSIIITKQDVLICAVVYLKGGQKRNHVYVLLVQLT